MEFLVIAVVVLILVIVLKIVFSYSMKVLKEIGEDNELDELAKKYPENIEMCKEYLQILGNEDIKVEESENSQASLYIAVTNKISIANIKNTYTRIQTIAHECLHSIQDRKLLMFNFVFSNIYLLYFLAICILTVFNIVKFKMIFLVILILFSFVYYAVRVFLENDAMIKARFLSEKYMKKNEFTSVEETEKLLSGFDKINNEGIKSINYYMFLQCMIKVLIYLVICYAF